MGHEKIIQWVYYYDKNRTRVEKKENSFHTKKTRTLKMFPFYILVNVGSLSWNVTAIFSPDSICIRYDKNINYQWISMISTELEILSVF